MNFRGWTDRYNQENKRSSVPPKDPENRITALR